MWIRYAGKVISDINNKLGWQNFISRASDLNGNKAHKWNKLDDNGMHGQGDGFQLLPGEYQIVPFTGSACWFGGTLGCCEYGNQCVINPNGRGSGTDASPQGQPSTLFEWTAPGVWDASLVDGFSLPMKIEVDGCSDPKNCNNSDPEVNLALSKELCPNKILDSSGLYIGCKSMCGCQNNAKSKNLDTDPDCPFMTPLSTIINQPFPPGGYCGCPCPNPSATDPKCKDGTIKCSPWLRDLFKRDKAGSVYCDAITAMTKNSKGQRSVYCQAYDDDAGTQSYGNGVIKVTLYNKGFESVKDKSFQCTPQPPPPGPGPTPPPQPDKLPRCSDIGIINDQCGGNKYICTHNKSTPPQWGCSQVPFPNCDGKQCIKN